MRKYDKEFKKEADKLPDVFGVKQAAALLGVSYYANFLFLATLPPSDKPLFYAVSACDTLQAAKTSSFSDGVFAV